MKTKILAFAAISLMICSCDPVNDFKANKCIAPLPAGVSVDSLTDCTVPASFSCDDFNWMGGNLTMTVYSQDLYDAVEVVQLQKGDTIIYESKPMVIDSISDNGGLLTINGGLEEGGCYLQGYEGGTYRAVQFDDHSIYTELGKAELPLAEDFIIIDCGINPDDPSDTIRTDQKLYLESQKDYNKIFFNLNTTVVITNGVITEINRKWIP